jgi:hypothetical protein
MTLVLRAFVIRVFAHPRFYFSINILSAATDKGPLSCARSSTDSPRHFESGDYKLRPLMVYHSENPRAFIRFRLYAFSIYAVIRWNATPAYNDNHL